MVSSCCNNAVTAGGRSIRLSKPSAGPEEFQGLDLYAIFQRPLSGRAGDCNSVAARDILNPQQLTNARLANLSPMAKFWTTDFPGKACEIAGGF
jgi:hypothetical protein